MKRKFKGLLALALALILAQSAVPAVMVSAALGTATRYVILNCGPVFEGPARNSWGDVVGYLDPGTPPGAVTFTVNAAAAGTYAMSIEHVTAWGAASHLYSINGGANILYNYPEGDWQTSPFSQDITLNQGNNTIKITYNSGVTELRSVTLQQYVADTATLAGISVTSPPAKVSYFVGEQLNLTGILVTGVYSDSTYKAVPITMANISGFNSAAPAASQTVTVTVDGFSAVFYVEIKEGKPETQTRGPSGNPYLPLWEHLPDNEPRVFEDPDNPGHYRAYITGSHDTRRGSYCGPDIRMWSAPVEDLTNWRDEGPLFTFRPAGATNWDVMYAPDIVEVRRFTPDVIARGRTAQDQRTIVEYYLYPHDTRDNGIVCKSSRPDGPYTPLNVSAGGSSLSGSIVGFDPSVWVDYIDDPADKDYNTGFRAYVYYGYQRSYADELDQSTMWSRRPGTSQIPYFMPSSSSYGVLRDPAGTTYPCLAPGEDPKNFNFFEASSMRKVGNKYICVFSGYSGPDYGLGSTNSALRWAYGDTPLGPFKAGGVLVDSRGPILNQNGDGIATGAWAHNTHGSLWEINGQWYTTYHRPPRGNMGARQAVVAPIKIEWTSPSVLDGGTVTITGYNQYAPDQKWTAKTSGGVEYKGAEITSEGFDIFGLPPYQYYSAGIVCDSQGTGTLQDSYDIWDNHMPIENVGSGYRAGFKYFGFGGLAASQKGLPPFDGTAPGNNTKFNLWLTPKTTSAFSVQVWLDGPWANATWNGKQIGTINVPANSAQATTQYSIDVSQYVDNLSGKHAIYLVMGSGTGTLCNLIGLGFSSDAHPITRPLSPTVNISVGGAAQTLPALPIASTDSNGIYDYYRYQVSTARPAGDATITASASDPSVKVLITQAPASGPGIVRFVYNGATKLYRLFADFTNVAATEAGQADAAAILAADSAVTNKITIYGSGFESPQDKIDKASLAIDGLIGKLGVNYTLTNVGGDVYSLQYSSGNTTMTVQPLNIDVVVDTVTVEGYTGLEAAMAKRVLDVNESESVVINAIDVNGGRVDVTAKPNLSVSVRNPAVASYAGGVLKGLSMGKTYLDALYTDSANNKLALSVEITVGNEIAPSATAISVNGKPVPGFSPSSTVYSLSIPAAPAIGITAVMPGEGLSYTVEAPPSMPGTAKVTVTSVWGKSITYNLNLSYAVTLGSDSKTVTADIGNPTETAKTARVIAAAYSADGRLAEVKSSALITIPANGYVPAVSASLTSDTKECTVKCFIWDDKFQPYGDSWKLKDPQFSIFPITFENGQLNGFVSRGGAPLSVTNVTRYNGEPGKALYCGGTGRQTWGGPQFSATSFIQPGLEYEFTVYVQSAAAASSEFVMTAEITPAGGSTGWVSLQRTYITSADGWVKFSGKRTFNAGDTVNIYVENADLNAFYIDSFSILQNGKPV